MFQRCIVALTALRLSAATVGLLPALCDGQSCSGHAATSHNTDARRLGAMAMIQTRNGLNVAAHSKYTSAQDEQAAPNGDASLHGLSQRRLLCAAFHDCPDEAEVEPWPWREGTPVPRRDRLPDVILDREPFVFNASLLQLPTSGVEKWSDLAFVRDVLGDAPLRVRVIPMLAEERVHHHHVMNPYSWENESWESTATLDELLANWADPHRDKHLEVYHTDVDQIAGLREELPFPAHYFSDDLPEDQKSIPWGASHLWMMNDGAVTQLHVDAPDNFIHVLSGNKEVLMFPPEDAPLMYRCNERRHHACGSPPQIAEHMSGVDLFSNFQDFPLLQHAHPRRINMQAGEVLWLPSKWWHLLASRGNLHDVAALQNPLQAATMFRNMWFCHPHNQRLPDEHPSSCPRNPREYLRSAAQERERLHYAYQPDEKRWSDGSTM